MHRSSLLLGSFAFGFSFACSGGGGPPVGDVDAGSVDAANGDAGSPGDAAVGDAAMDDAAMGDAAMDDAGRGGRDRYELSARFPEGGTFDPIGDAFYVGSLGDGSVHRVDRRSGVEETVFTETAPGTWWTLGMDVDPSRRLLFVCAMDDQREVTDEAPPYAGYVWVIDLLTHERVALHDLSDAHPRATCTDVTVLDDGTAFVTDREHPNVYRIPPGGDVELFVTDERLDGGVVGLNALVATADESALLAIVYLPSRLVRIDLTTRAVRDVEIDGGFTDVVPALSGADGMTWLGDALLVAFTSELVRLEPSLADWSAARSRSIDVPEGMTDVIVAEDEAYLLNGQAVRFAFGREPDPFALVRVAELP
jgi:sugar lactone lactonase YvrE